MLSIAFYTSASFFLSNADVASSRMSKNGFFKNARARAILYFSPPESYEPEVPTLVSIPSESLSIIFVAFAFAKASWISWSVASGLQ